ncbi:uncharacterized protein Z519_10003 [Cladophialophora bantiana CBS 173.52]|uniref:BTB domain-containing protein n=1 Tax=Cladophialophora bantiana (strain ATCC 10958 / CBS 173.52 / CDC B-1940 / NIH 8579) TaxID=1442370 RepID=A0A0D2EGG5_CLAB1|nr:uncharacterized protein Z519_10003 [Cladophialophora bantiana CBS 173.52]KIW89151.1 hypothetical protein Z519_10003 [Cladophialophora bantiana CBS 173.52]
MIHHLITYIYTDRVDFSDEDDEAISIMKAWVLAEKFCMPDQQNQLIDYLMEHWQDEQVRPAKVACVLDNVSKYSPLSKLVIDRFTHDLAFEYDYFLGQKNREGAEEHDKEFGALCSKTGCSVIRLVWDDLCLLDDDNDAKRPKPLAPINQGCKYHVHAGGG